MACAMGRQGKGEGILRSGHFSDTTVRLMIWRSNVPKHTEMRYLDIDGSHMGNGATQPQEESTRPSKYTLAAGRWGLHLGLCIAWFCEFALVIATVRTSQCSPAGE